MTPPPPLCPAPVPTARLAARPPFHPNAPPLTLAAAGKKQLGFVAPAIYAVAASTPAAFTDVTSGSNRCTESSVAPPCAQCTGFDAAVGAWRAGGRAGGRV